MSENNTHLDLFNEQLTWQVSNTHDYELIAERNKLGVKARIIQSGVTETLPHASTLDHFVWDEMVNTQEGLPWCETLTLWTQTLEFNILVFGNDSRHLKKIRCAYFSIPPRKQCGLHHKYWKFLFGESLPKSIGNSGKIEASLPSMVLWNRYNEPQWNGNDICSFKRTHAYTFDVYRFLFQTIPVPTGFLDISELSGNAQDNATQLYKQVLIKYKQYSACCSSMTRNLLALSSLLADPNLGIVLVTGEPGTGKEAYCNALYYSNKLKEPHYNDKETIFVQTTAAEIRNARDDTGTRLSPSSFLKKEVSDNFEKKVPQVIVKKPIANKPTIFVDELNKAKKSTLGAMLRTLEQGDEELEVSGKPVFIFAASQHIDDLAKQPPQDFWTRISHQLRVVHPLSRVTEKDGRDYLSSFFYVNWLNLVSKAVEGMSDNQAKNIVHVLFGERAVGRQEIRPSPICVRVRDEFLNTLVPLVSRDTLSVRGVRSILSQVFARLNWYVRFEDPFVKIDEATENAIAQRVNSAIQEVLTVLNAARDTPASLQDD